MSDGTDICLDPGQWKLVQVTLQKTGDGGGNDRIRTATDASGLLSILGQTLARLGGDAVIVEVSRIVYSEFISTVHPPSVTTPSRCSWRARATPMTLATANSTALSHHRSGPESTRYRVSVWPHQKRLSMISGCTLR